MMSISFNNWNIWLKFLRELIGIYMVYGGLNIYVLKISHFRYLNLTENKKRVAIENDVSLKIIILLSYWTVIIRYIQAADWDI